MAAAELEFLRTIIAPPEDPREVARRQRVEKAARVQRRETFLVQADGVLSRWGKPNRVSETEVLTETPEVPVQVGSQHVILKLARRLETVEHDLITEKVVIYEVGLYLPEENEPRRFFSLRQETRRYSGHSVERATYPRNWKDGVAQIADYDQALVLLSVIEAHLSSTQTPRSA